MVFSFVSAVETEEGEEAVHRWRIHENIRASILQLKKQTGNCSEIREMPLWNGVILKISSDPTNPSGPFLAQHTYGSSFSQT